jgi:rRNA maturation endonuclease Nob1
MNECPICGSQLLPDTHSFVDYGITKDPKGVEKKSPQKIEVTMFENHLCPECGTRVWTASELETFLDLKNEKDI